MCIFKKWREKRKLNKSSGSMGYFNVKEFLEKTDGQIRGKILTDAKIRYYSADYKWDANKSGYVWISRKNGSGDKIRLKECIELDERLISFFGLYSGDGAKGSEDPKNPGQLKTQISFSQREPNIVKFAVQEFRRLFSDSIRFVFSLGEDSAYFMADSGNDMLKEYYGGKIPKVPKLTNIRPNLNDADKRYLAEKRNVVGTNEEHLAFYYFHKSAMESILTDFKHEDIKKVGIQLNSNDKVTASLRRPFKKGARKPGGSSRSDELHVGGLNGFGEFFLKMLYELEDSILHDTTISPQGMVKWNDKPSNLGEMVDVKNFFEENNYGQIAGERPTINDNGINLRGRWPRSKEIDIHNKLLIDPLWCYVSGLYLAEGTTPKSVFFSMFNKKPKGLGIGFTSSEGTSIELMLRTLKKLFPAEYCLDAWKIKVGSQYFPELVVIGLKHGVPLLRGGSSGDGKLRTMEISLSLKDWALQLAPSLMNYADKYSHVEPTGAGLPRIDFWASSALARWYFPLIMYSIFRNQILDPSGGFINE